MGYALDRNRQAGGRLGRTGFGLGVLFALLTACAVGAGTAAAQDANDEPEHFVVIHAGKVITNAATDGEIDDAVIVIVNGRIRSVGKGLDYPLNARVIDARDRVVMPGFINPHSRFGMPRYQRGGVRGDLGVKDEFLPPDEVYAELLDSGYTALALVPDGTGIPGRAMVTRIAGPREARVLVSQSYLRVTNEKGTLRDGLERAKKEIEKVDKAREEWEKKQAEEKKKAEEQKKAQEQQKKEGAAEPKPDEKKEGGQPPATQPAEFKPPPIAPPLQPLVDLIQKKEQVFALIELGNASDYVHMRDVLDKFEIAHQFYAINGLQSDFDYVVQKVGKAKPRLVIQPLISWVPNSTERTHLVRSFGRAGCEISLTPRGDSLTEHLRMLARVAELVREGWAREEALKALTLHPARLLGLDDRLGSIEKDKEADLLFLDGDPFAPATRVRAVMIAGEIVHRVEDSQ